MAIESARTLLGKTLVLTEDVIFGIGMSEIEDGDILVIPLDIDCPLILRREANSRTESGSDHGTFYRIAGTANMDGLMKGLTDTMVERRTKEGLLPGHLETLAEFDSKLTEEVKRRKIEKFLLH